MTQVFFDIIQKPSPAFEATLRDQVMRADASTTNWIWYLLGSISVVSVCAFVFVPYLSFTLNFLLLDTLI